MGQKTKNKLKFSAHFEPKQCVFRQPEFALSGPRVNSKSLLSDCTVNLLPKQQTLKDTFFPKDLRMIAWDQIQHLTLIILIKWLV